MKVFQIGFPKCGTTSIAKFFSINGIPSISWKKKQDSIFYSNLKAGIHPFKGLEDYTVFTDSEFVRNEFSLLDHLYPNSKFIYNVRPLKKWLNSRLNGRYAGGVHPIEALGNKTYREYYSISSNDQFLQLCKYEWFYHRSRIERYFSGNNVSKLLIFDIEKDPAKKIVDFLPEFKFTHLKFPKENVSR